jgi:hypothetical protein
MELTIKKVVSVFRFCIEREESLTRECHIEPVELYTYVLEGEASLLVLGVINYDLCMI